MAKDGDQDDIRRGFLRHLRKVHFSLLAGSLALLVTWIHLSHSPLSEAVTSIDRLISLDELQEPDHFLNIVRELDDEICSFKVDFQTNPNWTRDQFSERLRRHFTTKRTGTEWPRYDFETIWGEADSFDGFFWVSSPSHNRYLPDCYKPPSGNDLPEYACCELDLAGSEFEGIDEVIATPRVVTPSVLNSALSLPNMTLSELEAHVHGLNGQVKVEYPLALKLGSPEEGGSAISQETVSVWSELVAPGVPFYHEGSVFMLREVTAESRDYEYISEASVTYHPVYFELLGSYLRTQGITDLAQHFDVLSAWAAKNGRSEQGVQNVIMSASDDFRASVDHVQLAGLSLPAYLISTAGIVILCSLQLYFLLHARALTGMFKRFYSDDLPWIGIYKDPFAASIAVISVWLPLVITILLVQSLKGTGAVDSLFSAFAVLLLCLSSFYVAANCSRQIIRLQKLTFDASARRSLS